MPHADSSLVPDDIKTKVEFYDHIYTSLEGLLAESRYWVSNLAQTSSLLYHAYLSSPLYGIQAGPSHSPVINWVGFYLHPPGAEPPSAESPVILGPYQGRPACVSFVPKRGKGVCADAFVGNQTVVVENVDDYPGHIACDGESKSEIVIPLRTSSESTEDRVIGVFDLDSTSLATFDSSDKAGLEKIAALLQTICDWS